MIRPLAKEFSRWPLAQTQRFAIGEAWVQLHHEIGGGTYKSAPLEREIVRDLLAAGRHKWQDHHLLVRAHRHCWGGWFEGKRVARKVPHDIREPRHAASKIAPSPVRSAPKEIRAPAKGGATAIPVVRLTSVPKDIREPAREPGQ